MDNQKSLATDDSSRKPSRREVLAGTGAVGLMLMNSSSVFAQGADGANTIRVGFISPRSGPLAGFGETDGYVLDLARKSLAGGLTVGGKKYAVEILDRDTQSDPARASQLAKALIDSSKVDLILTTSAPETTNPVADACEAAGVPCVATVVPWESFYFGRGAKPGAPSPFKWSYVFSFGVGEFAKSYASAWSELPTNKRVAALYPNDADGNAIREHLGPELEKAGFTLIDAGPYEDGTTDYSAQISKLKAAKCDIFNTFPIPPDFAAFWRQATQQGLTKTIKIAQIAKTAQLPSSVTSLGLLGYNLAAGAYWHKNFPYKSRLTGVTGVELADGYEKAANKQWTQQLGASMSLIDVGLEALKTSSDPKNKASVAKALSTLKTSTMVGKVDFTSGPVANVSVAPIIGTQWIKAAPGSRFKLDFVIVENACDRNVPVGAKLRPYAV